MGTRASKRIQRHQRILVEASCVTTSYTKQEHEVVHLCIKFDIRQHASQEHDDGVKRAIYYLSRLIIDGETRYNFIKNLCQSLYFSCMKLKCYIKSTDVFFIHISTL